MTRNSKFENNKENSFDKQPSYQHSPQIQTYEQVERTYSTTIKKSDGMDSYSPRPLVNAFNRNGLKTQEGQRRRHKSRSKTKPNLPELSTLRDSVTQNNGQKLIKKYKRSIRIAMPEKQTQSLPFHQIRYIQEQSRKMSKVKCIQYEPELTSCSLSQHIRISKSLNGRKLTSTKRNYTLSLDEGA